MENRKICIKCLLEDINEKEILVKIRELIDAIPEEDRTEKTEYDRRLSICRNCENLINGTCKKCGCYVELRAAGKKRYCPGNTDLWRL